MPLRKSVVYKHTAVTASDALDGENAPKGAMTALQNLVPDPSTANIWIPRPASTKLTSFTGFTTPGFVSVQIVVGNYVLGMVATGRNAGKDEPFVYNLATSSFVTVSGVTSSNVPTSPSTSGAWTPPTMALIGTKVAVTHPGFDGVTNFVGWLDISNPASPVWSAGNTSGTALPSVPVAVAQFSQRAYYLVNPTTGQPAAIATDVLDPTKRSNATYVLTFGDDIPLTAAAGLPLDNALGGIFQSLMIFKGANNIFQVTGDFASTTSPIAQNSLNISTGTNAPNSICETPLGLAFMSPEGLRIIDFTAHISEPIGIGGTGVTVPFIYSVVPSRMAAACNSVVIRISTQNGNVVNTPQQEWWYDLARKLWSGPHTFPASTISAYGDSFVLTPVGINSSLWKSDPYPNLSSTYIENGNTIVWNYQTSLLPERDDMHQCSMIESLIYMAFAPASQGVVVTANDQNGTQLGSVNFNPIGVATLWGSFLWGNTVWGGGQTAIASRNIHWSQPIVFDRMSISVKGVSAQGVRLGDCFIRYQPLNYLSQP
jgi:hypothetical protein